MTQSNQILSLKLVSICIEGRISYTKYPSPDSDKEVLR